MNTTKRLLEKFKIRKGFNLISLPSISLVEQEADRFITYLVDQSVMKGYARIERMTLPQKNIRALGFGAGSFLFPADHFDETKYKKTFTHNRIPLNTKKIRGCVAIFDDDLEDIAGVTTEAEYKDQLMKLITAKMANELEVAAWIAETHALNGFAADDIRGMWDGWRYRITHSAVGQTYYNNVTGAAHLLEACTGGTTGSPFNAAGLIAEREAGEPYDWEFKYHMMLKTMPAVYKANNGLANMSFLNSDLVTQDYLAALSSRGTVLGDAVFLGTAQPMYNRVKILDVPLMPITLGSPGAGTDGVLGAGAYTDVLLTPKGNLIVGIQRDIKLESKREAADEATYVFFSMRVDWAIENVDAVVLLRCLEHAC